MTIDRAEAPLELSCSDAKGITWFTPGRLLPQWQREVVPQGYYNLGVAHGVPGVITVLSAMHAAGLVRSETGALLSPAVDWLLAQELDQDSASCFPSWVADGVEPKGARLAWCYGDAGIAVALMAAARHAGEARWEEEALRIARRAVRRNPDDTGVRDACLCHGNAGLAHIFNRLFQASGDDEMAEVARFWYRRTIGMRRAGEGIAGWLTWDAGANGLEERGTPGFLTGANGIALSLLAAITGADPAWDHLLLTTTPA